MKITTQPTKDQPADATHWCHSLINPFFKRTLVLCNKSQCSTLDMQERLGIGYDSCNIDDGMVYTKDNSGKWYEDNRLQFIEGKWEEVIPEIRYGNQRAKHTHQLTALKPIDISSKRPRVNTIHGTGTLLGREKVTGRYITELDKNPFDYNPVYLFEKEIIQ